MPRISVLMPVYNGIPYICEAVESVLCQEFQDWELVISDNGSEDETRDYLATLCDTRIRVYFQDENLGIFGNLNFLLEHAASPIAQLLCADDKLLPGTLDAVAQFMESLPQCAISSCLGVGGLTSSINAQLQGALPDYIIPKAAVLAFATFGNIAGILTNVACRPGLVLQAGGFNQRYPYAGDYEGWSRVAMLFGIHLHKKELIWARQHMAQNSYLLSRKNELYPQINAILEMLVSKVDESDLPVLKRHWTIHFFPPRTSRFVRQVLTGNFRLAASAWHGLPLGISGLTCLAAYPVRKFNLWPARATTQRLWDRIWEINRGQS